MTALCNGLCQPDNRCRQQHRLAATTLAALFQSTSCCRDQDVNTLILCEFHIRRENQCPRTQILEGNSMENEDPTPLSRGLLNSPNFTIFRYSNMKFRTLPPPETTPSPTTKYKDTHIAEFRPFKQTFQVASNQTYELKKNLTTQKTPKLKSPQKKQGHRDINSKRIAETAP